MKKKYDFAFPLGAACASSLAMRVAGLQSASLPFDWVGGGNIVGRARLVANGFRDWLRPEDLELTDVIHTIFNSSIYRNRVTELTFSHDFPAGCYLEDEYPSVAAKFERRIARLYAEIDKAKSVLVVYNEIPYRPVAADADIVEAQRLLQERFPDKIIDLLYFAQDPECVDRPPRTVNERVTAILLDYKTMERGYVSVAAVYGKMVKPLMEHGELAGKKEAVKSAKSIVSKERELRRWGVGYRRWLNKRLYHLYRHLDRYLSKQGCIPSMERPVKLYKERGERRRSLEEPDISQLPRDEAAARRAYDLL